MSHIYNQVIFAKSAKDHIIIKKQQYLQQIVLGKQDLYLQKNEVGPLPYIKMD